MKVYNAKCVPMATYGCDIWGYCDSKEIQGAENSFMRRVLSVPVSTPIFNAHEDLGMGYISDLVAVAPLLRWLRIWAQPAPNLNQQILLDCLNLGRVLDIPWINYIKTQMVSLGCPNLFLSPAPLGKTAIKVFKHNFLARRTGLRDDIELIKPKVRSFEILSLCHQMQPYLTFINRPYHLFVLIRFRHNMVIWLLTFPKGYSKEGSLGPCPCDDFSKQDILHVMFFCAFYNSLRRKFILPLLRGCNFTQVRPALVYLQMFASPLTCFGVASFLTGAIRQRDKLDRNGLLVLDHTA